MVTMPIYFKSFFFFFKKISYLNYLFELRWRVIKMLSLTFRRQVNLEIIWKNNFINFKKKKLAVAYEVTLAELSSKQHEEKICKVFDVLDEVIPKLGIYSKVMNIARQQLFGKYIFFLNLNFKFFMIIFV